jgi:PAS domain S-box-containing protein
MLGYTADEIVGQPCWKFIVDEFAREQIQAKLGGVRPPGVGLERTYQRQDGATFPVLFEDRLLLDEDGHIKGIRTAIQDITERKHAEEEREKLQAQLTQAQKMESVGRLAGGVAHDFNNMLGVIFGHTEMALEDVDPAAPLYGSLQAIQHAAERSAPSPIKYAFTVLFLKHSSYQGVAALL